MAPIFGFGKGKGKEPVRKQRSFSSTGSSGSYTRTESSFDREPPIPIPPPQTRQPDEMPPMPPMPPPDQVRQPGPMPNHPSEYSDSSRSSSFSRDEPMQQLPPSQLEAPGSKPPKKKWGWSLFKSKPPRGAPAPFTDSSSSSRSSLSMGDVAAGNMKPPSELSRSPEPARPPASFAGSRVPPSFTGSRMPSISEAGHQGGWGRSPGPPSIAPPSTAPMQPVSYPQEADVPGRGYSSMDTMHPPASLHGNPPPPPGKTRKKRFGFFTVQFGGKKKKLPPTIVEEVESPYSLARSISEPSRPGSMAMQHPMPILDDVVPVVGHPSDITRHSILGSPKRPPISTLPPSEPPSVSQEPGLARKPTQKKPGLGRWLSFSGSKNKKRPPSPIPEAEHEMTPLQRTQSLPSSHHTVVMEPGPSFQVGRGAGDLGRYPSSTSQFSKQAPSDRTAMSYPAQHMAGPSSTSLHRANTAASRKESIVPPSMGTITPTVINFLLLNHSATYQLI
ncbi:hypothetical protein DL96DRAFT_676759 [Flagelloscypha sp. PMI_526]|nr:hypothetical protein DL96DRAFT_676759 [Flagelloscypha sp. PMI_526]